MEDWIAQKKAAMNPRDKLMYWLYKKKDKALAVSKTSHGMGPPKAELFNKSKAEKASYAWELANLYYEGV